MPNTLELITIIILATMTIADWLITNIGIVIAACIASILVKNYRTNK